MDSMHNGAGTLGADGSLGTDGGLGGAGGSAMAARQSGGNPGSHFEGSGSGSKAGGQVTGASRAPSTGVATPPQYAHIVGWGADLDRANRPAYPMERTPPRLPGLTRQGEPERQPIGVEVLQSNERPTMTPVFGSPQPPRGVSGMLRRAGFKYSENDLRHWLILLLADRVDVVEGFAEDLQRGHVPRVYAEMGGGAELRYNPIGATRKLLTLVAVGSLAYLALSRRSDRGSDRRSERNRRQED